MAIHIRPREVVVTLGGIAAVRPLVSHAWQSERVRRIGVLMLNPEKNLRGRLRAKAFQEGLQKLARVRNAADC